MSKLILPLVGKDNRPIRDRTGQLLSIPENAQTFVAALNLVHEIALMDDDIVPDDLWKRAREIAGLRQ